MEMESGIRINPADAGHHGHEPQGGHGSRRQQHQRKLKALVEALDAGDLIEAKVTYRLLLEFSPALEHGRFVQVGQALDQANLPKARRVIEEIYGQSQAIFKRPAPKPAISLEPPPPARKYFGVLVDCSA